jgi:serine/threonine-protein phosphatase PGAM5
MPVKQYIPIWLTAPIIGCLLSWSAPSVGQSANHAVAESFVRTIFLVRHGAYDASGKVDSPDGPGLLPLGIAQARLVGARLRGLPGTITALTTSTMTRARDTAAVISESLPTIAVQETSLLRECTPPARDDDRKEDENTEREQQACKATLDEAFAQYFIPARGQERHDVLVCHGNVIRYFVMKALGVDTKAWPGMSIAHASLTAIQVMPKGTFRVLSVGDVGHISPSLQSGTTAVDSQLVVPRKAAGPTARVRALRRVATVAFRSIPSGPILDNPRSASGLRALWR